MEVIEFVTVIFTGIISMLYVGERFDRLFYQKQYTKTLQQISFMQAENKQLQETLGQYREGFKKIMEKAYKTSSDPQP